MMGNRGNKILFLGEAESPLLSWLEGTENKTDVLQTTGKISPDYLIENKVGFIVSYGYRHIIKPDVLAYLPNKVINLHISYLPWNRGADPNLWSFVDSTPKGVTIHYVDEDLDTGDIIVQKEVTFLGVETLASSYQRLQKEIQTLFQQHWPAIKNGSCEKIKQQGEGSSHKIKDKEAIAHLLTQGWETPVKKLLGA